MAPTPLVWLLVPPYALALTLVPYFFDPLNNCVVIGVARNVEVFNLPVLDQLLKFLQGNCVIGPVIAPDRHHGLTGLDDVRGGRIGIGGGKQVGC